MYMEHGYFFDPRKGRLYDEGFLGLKTLIVGVAHICTHECRYHEKCKYPGTIREMDRECPLYKGRGDYYRLSNSNEIEICSFIDGDAKYPAYSSFTYYMLGASDVLTPEMKSSFWESVAFTNYFQVFHDNDELSGISERTFEGAYGSLVEVADMLRPDVVLVWNPVVCESIRKSVDHRFRYVGKADMSFHLSVFVFVTAEGKSKGAHLRKLYYRLGVKSEGHKNSWYENLVSRHLGKAIPDDGYKKKKIGVIAEKLHDWVTSGWLKATDSALYFSDTDTVKWKTAYIGMFVRNLKIKFGLMRGANEGLSAMFSTPSIEKYHCDESRVNEKDRLYRLIAEIVSDSKDGMHSWDFRNR